MYLFSSPPPPSATWVWITGAPYSLYNNNKNNTKSAYTHYSITYSWALRFCLSPLPFIHHFIHLYIFIHLYVYFPFVKFISLQNLLHKHNLSPWIKHLQVTLHFWTNTRMNGPGENGLVCLLFFLCCCCCWRPKELHCWLFAAPKPASWCWIQPTSRPFR